MPGIPITPAQASELLSELRRMALLPPGPDEAALTRAREIRALLQAGQAADRVLGGLEILLSRRRWKQEAPSVEALRKQIKMACDQLRVAVEARAR